MAVSLWARLTLRWQVVAAILIPSAAVPIFSSLYFPSRLNAQAQESLHSRARSMGALATSELAPTLRLITDGLSTPQDLDKVLEGLKLSGDVAFAGVLDAAGKSVIRGDLPPGTYARPQAECDFDDAGTTLIMRCAILDEVVRGTLVVGFFQEKLVHAQRVNQLVGFAALGVAVALGLLLAFIFSGALATPVAQVTQAAREVAAGDVTVPEIEVAATAEIRSMAKSFNEMLANLRQLVIQIVELTGRLSGASKGLLGASLDQEHVTNQQAAYAQDIAATFEQLSRTAEQISSSTDVVEQASRRTNEAVEEARAVFAEVSTGMAEIRAESKSVADAIQKLNQDLQEVSKIAQVINTVAERSDLLALNAALEGTKAGEVGRGFSLVAAEMRKLAESVSGSARDIGRIVGKIQESGNQAVSKARAGVAASDRGVKVADQAAAVFQRIVELARGTTDAAQQITTATKQQRQSSDQAVQGARNVADLVKQGVDATSRTTKIAQDLQTVAQALAALTARFKVREDLQEPGPLLPPPPAAPAADKATGA